ncbi:MAG: protein kinase [Actinomycetota bacterium]|nr:protein kinase [Actinomycetota bacterium]
MKNDDQFGGWLLGEEIGRSANSRVYRAERSDTSAVVKVATAKKRTSERYLRFVREIEALQALGDDPGVMPLIESNLPAASDVGHYPWYAMPEGVPLDRLLKNASLEGVVTALASIAATLSRLHQRGYQHRDVKPQNLFLLPGDTYVVGDLGLIAVPDEVRESLTTEGSLVGPANFTAPEMVSVDPSAVDARFADVYSLAKVLWALAAGERYPLPGHQRASDRRSLVAETGEGRAEALDQMIEQATEHEPERRPSMNEMAAVLQAWLPSPEQEESDLADLEAAVRGARAELSGQHSAEQNRHRRHAEADAAFEDLMAELDPAFIAVTQIGTSHVTDSPESPDATLQFPSGETFGGPQIEWTRSRYDHAAIGSEIEGVRLGLAMSVSLYDNGQLLLLAGIAVDELPLTLGPSPFYWADRSEAKLGTVEVRRAIEELGKKGRGEMVQAVEKFAEAGKSVDN